MQRLADPTTEQTLRPRLRVARYPFETGINPYQSLFYRSLERHGIELAADGRFTVATLVRLRRRVSVLHFNWRLDRLYGARPTRARLALAQLRLRVAEHLGYRIAWTIHELASRECPGSREPMADALARAAHVLFCHDPDLADRAAAELGIDRARIEVIPHGPLASAYPRPRSTRAEIRADLGVSDDDTVLLSFGSIRRYKELDLVCEAFARVQAPTARLVIAGLPDLEAIASVRVAAARDPRIVLLDRFVPAEQVRELFAAADVAVLGRRDGWTSGALVLALSLGLPSIVAAQPAYLTLIGQGRAGWAFDPDGGADALAAAVEEAIAAPRSVREAAGAAAVALTAELRWEDAATRVAERLTGHGERSQGGITLTRATADA